jgi:hypothetical protein
LMLAIKSKQYAPIPQSQWFPKTENPLTSLFLDLRINPQQKIVLNPELNFKKRNCNSAHQA